MKDSGGLMKIIMSLLLLSNSASAISHLPQEGYTQPRNLRRYALSSYSEPLVNPFRSITDVEVYEKALSGSSLPKRLFSIISAGKNIIYLIKGSSTPDDRVFDIDLSYSGERNPKGNSVDSLLSTINHVRIDLDKGMFIAYAGKKEWDYSLVGVYSGNSMSDVKLRVSPKY